MKNIVYHTEDKSEWDDGPWKDEPDKLQWLDEKTGYPCLIVRNTFGCLCGYVGVPAGHSAYEKPYNDVDVRVHGGLTFADHCHEGGKICHLVDDGEDDNVWWLGFDCGHSGDLYPFTGRHDRSFSDAMSCYPGAEYRDVAYLKAECRRLAEQLKAMT